MKEPVVVLNDIYKKYENGVEAVKGLNLEVYRNEVIGFLGPNGAGKTTTIKMIVGLLKPTRGTITIFGKSLTPSSYEKIKDKIGYCPQELVFYSHLTVQENADLFATIYNVPQPSKKIDELFSLFKLENIKNRLAKNLSGGQKRRLNTVLSLLNSPELLILDEPSVGMDPQSRQVLWENIQKLVKEEGMTIILTTHLMEVADRLSDRICIIDNGKVIALGTPDELKRKANTHEVLEVHLKPFVENSLKKKLLEKLSNIGLKARVLDSSLLITTKKGLSDMADLLELLKKNNYMGMVYDVSFREKTLEDVFIELTGKKLRE